MRDMHRKHVYVDRMEALSITEVRSNLAEIVRRLANDKKPVGITVNGRTQAVLSPLHEAGNGGGTGEWFQAARSLPTKSLPAPFAEYVRDDNGIGACLWIHASSGAMITAIPQGRWDTPGAMFAFYYSHPALPSAVHLDGWTYSLLSWENHSSNGYEQRRADVISLFHNRIAGDDVNETR